MAAPFLLVPPAAARAPVDLWVTSDAVDGHRPVRVGDPVTETFTIGGLPGAGTVVVLDLDWGTSFTFGSVALPGPGPDLPCDVDTDGAHAQCEVTSTGGAVSVTVTVDAVAAGIDSQYLQVSADLPGVVVTGTSDDWAAAEYRVLSADLQLLPGSRSDGRVVRGADLSQYAGVSPVDLVATSSVAVDAEVVLTRAGSVPVDVARVTLTPGGAPVPCTATAPGSLTCPLGTVQPGGRIGLYVFFSAPATAPVGAVGAVVAEVRPVPGQGGGLSTSSVDLSAVVDPRVVLSTTVTTAGGAPNAAGSVTVVDVPVGRPRTVRLTVANGGPDDAPGAVVRVAPSRYRWSVPAGLPSLFSLTPVTPSGTFVRDGDGWWTWTPGAVPAGGSRTIDVQVTALRRGYAPGGGDYDERLVVEPASVVHADGVRSTRSSCTLDRDEPGNCFAHLGTAPGPVAPTARGSVRDVDADRFADLLAVDAEGDLHLFPSDLAGRPGVPYTEDVVAGTGWQGFVRTVAADVDGDGAADVLATDPAGGLWLYRNALPSGADTPYSSGVRIGSGWRGYPQVTAGDVSGDGKADLVATGPDGRLWYFLNTGNPSAPYGTGRQIGSGWQGYTHVTAGDVSGDGAADLVATGPDGRLWYFPNNSSTNPGRVPFVQGLAIGSGWQGFRHVQAADVDGDGSADLVAVDRSGTLLWFPNNRSSNPGGLPYARGEQIGSGWQVFRLLL